MKTDSVLYKVDLMILAFDAKRGYYKRLRYRRLNKGKCTDSKFFASVKYSCPLKLNSVTTDSEIKMWAC